MSESGLSIWDPSRRPELVWRNAGVLGSSLRSVRICISRRKYPKGIGHPREDTYALMIQMKVDLLNGLIVGNKFLPVLLGHDVVDEVD